MFFKQHYLKSNFSKNILQYYFLYNLNNLGSLLFISSTYFSFTALKTFVKECQAANVASFKIQQDILAGMRFNKSNKKGVGSPRRFIIGMVCCKNV